MSNPKIDGVEILGVTVVLYGERTDDDEIDLGSVTISRDGREYMLDVCQSYTKIDGGFTTIETDLERDDELFEDCTYDITSTDLMSSDLLVSLYIGGDHSLTIEHMTLFVRFGGENGMTKAINVVED